MLFNLLAPEMSLAKAWADSRAVDHVKDALHKTAEIDDVYWENCHSHFANLGGFVISFAALPTSLPSEGSHRSSDIDLMSRRGSVPSESPHRSCGPGSMSTRGSIPSEENLAKRVSLSNEEPHLSCLGHADSEIPLGEINRQQDERNQEQNIRHLTGRSNSGKDTNLESGEFSGVASPTGLVAQPGAFPGKSLSPVLRKRFDQVKQRSVLNPLSKYLRLLSRFLGPLEIIPHPPNTISAMESLDGVRMDHFDTPWEKSRFLTIGRSWVSNVLAFQGDRWVVDASQLLYARDMGIIERLPSLSADNIQDRSKEDLFAKSLALVQITWFLIQTITRLCQGLATTPLELMTFAFAISTGFTYFLLLDKPKDVGTSVTIPASRYASPQEMTRLAVAGPYSQGRGIWIPNYAVHATRGQTPEKHLLLGASFSVLLLGAIHCIGWNFKYPTDVELWLWRASSIITAAVLPFMGAASLLYVLIVRVFKRYHLAMLDHHVFEVYGGVANGFLWVVFVGARLFILVEAIRSLAFLPSDAFKTTWPDNIPHIG